MEQHRRYLFFEFLEEFHGHPVVPWSLPFGEGFDGVRDILEGEVSSQPLVHSLRDLGRDALPTDRLRFRYALSQRVRGI